MTDAQDAEGNPLPDSQLLRQLRRFLRSTSLDELHEPINVRGERPASSARGPGS